MLAILPTGGGKSVCFQVPALMQKGLCIVISPLIALMKDQVENLNARGVHAAAIHSGLNKEDINEILQDAFNEKLKFLYVSPERIDTTVFQDFLGNANVNLIAVDEAHCISQWGYDFRPSYLKIARIRLIVKSAPIIALTASATDIVKKDIIEKLYFRKYDIITRSFERPNLSYSVFFVENKITKLVEILRKVSGSGIVYGKTRRIVQDIATMLRNQNINADFYHAGIDADLRAEKQKKWINNQTRIIVCTNAFGMGIDKPDVRVVVHYDTPDCLENYYQEAGRAGRDELKAYAVLLYNQKDINDFKALPDVRFPGFEIIQKIYGYIGDYLQVPSGTGKDMSFNFNFKTFIENFKLDTLQTIYAIKAIEEQGHIQYNENLFVASKVQFITDRDNVEAFEDAHESLEPIIKALLRTYEGIFSKNVYISEDKLAGKLRTTSKEVKKQLNILHKQGIINYTAQTDIPQIYFLMNRSVPKYMYFDHEAYKTRKHAFEKKLKHIINYVALSKTCRSTYIARYFGDEKIKDCGICDNCLKRKTKPLTAHKLAEISKEIEDLLTGNSMSLTQMENRLTKFTPKNIKETLHYLHSEGKILLQTDGKISLSK